MTDNKRLVVENSTGQVWTDGEVVWVEIRDEPTRRTWDPALDWWDPGYIPIDALDGAIQLLARASVRLNKGVEL